MYLQRFILAIILISNYNKANATPYIKDNLIQSVEQQEIFEKTKKTTSRDNVNVTVASLADLYYFYPNDRKGIFNCSYRDTVNITGKTLSKNGSYSYVLPPELVGDYDYEILYNGSKRSVPLHKRACICQLKPCIPLCSKVIPETYNYVVTNGLSDLLEMFTITTTLKNNTRVMKNIGKDFVPNVLNQFCDISYYLVPELDEKYGWTLYENGSLQMHSDKTLLQRNEYCFDIHEQEIDNERYDLINPKVCANRRQSLGTLETFNYYIQIISVIFLILTIIVYCFIPELLNVHGKCLITYVGCLAMSFTIFSFINLSGKIFPIGPCLIMGYLNHFFQLSHFTWLGIICYDIWKTLSDFEYESTYRTYVKYGFTLPFLMLLFTIVMQYMDIPESFKPGVIPGRCGLDVYKWSAVIYLYGPSLIILIFCLKFFIDTLKVFQTNDREVTEVMSKIEPTNKRYTLYFRLFMMMGVSWNLDILSYIIRDWKTISSIVDYINSLQGLYIFINFVVRRRIWNIIYRRYILKVA